MKYNMLTIVEELGSNKHRQKLVKVICECGNESIKVKSEVLSGHSRSCGCMRVKAIKLACTKDAPNKPKRLYVTWLNMKARCYNPKGSSYNRYGARGITICDEWIHSFETFESWALSHNYKSNLTIERKDNDGNYEPLNCEWITKGENTRRANAIKKLSLQILK